MTKLAKNSEREMVGNVCVFGADLVHPDVLGVLNWALERVEHKLNAVFFTEIRNGEKELGLYNAHSRSMVIKLPVILEQVLTSSSDEDLGWGLNAHLWVQTLYCIFHELHHHLAVEADMKENDLKYFTEEWWAKEEEAAADWAWLKTEEVTIKMGLEPPKIDELYWVGDGAMTFLIDNGDPEWARRVKDRLDKGLVFESKGDCFDSLVSYFRTTTEHPELYEKENEGAACEIGVEQEVPNLYDQKILPGQQGELFGRKSESVSTPKCERAEEPTSVTSTQGGQNMAYTGDGIHDHLPPEAYGDYDKGGDAANDPFAPNYGVQTSNPTPTPTPAANTTPTPAPKVPQVSTGLRDIILNLYSRLDRHIFSNASIYDLVPLTNAEKELGVVVGCVTRQINEKGESYEIVGDVAKTGGVYGYITSKAKVKMYDLKLNWDGRAMRIRLIQQNPNKEGSKAAVRARNGEQITWVMEVHPDGKGTFRGVFENGTYRTMEAR